MIVPLVSSVALSSPLFAPQQRSFGGGVGEGAGSYGSDGFTQTSRLIRNRKSISYASEEKKRATEFWENQLVRKGPSAAEMGNFKHFTKLEEEERLAEAKREEERIRERVEISKLRFGEEVRPEKPVPMRNLKPNIREEYGDDKISDPAEMAERAARHHIVSLLVKAERRIKFGADYGSLRVMAILNDGLMLLDEAEDILKQRHWLSAEAKERIESLRKHAADVKFELDID